MTFEDLQRKALEYLSGRSAIRSPQSERSGGMTHLDDFYQDWDLRDAFEEKVRECNALNAEISRLLQKLIDGEQRMRELEGDRERLDFLEEKRNAYQLEKIIERIVTRCYGEGVYAVREAIDAARGEGK